MIVFTEQDWVSLSYWRIFHRCKYSSCQAV